MQRKAFKMYLLHSAEYKKIQEEIWPELVELQH
jgi:L-rhamnose mutarotase